MKLDYFTLLSKSPLKLNICSIKSPLLREIDEITIQIYNHYLNLLLLDINLYYKMVMDDNNGYLSQYSEEENDLIFKIKDEYDNMSESEKVNVSTISILSFDSRIMESIAKALDFFIVESVEYSPQYKSFLLFDGHLDNDGHLIPSGQINNRNFSIVIDLILQKNAVTKNVTNEDISRVKNKKALEILNKIKKGQEELDKVKKVDKKMELGNLISAVAGKNNNGINILNIWDMTIYQLYDQFRRIQINDFHNISLTSVSVWGDKEKKFNSNLWLENIHYN